MPLSSLLAIFLPFFGKFDVSLISVGKVFFGRNWSFFWLVWCLLISSGKFLFASLLPLWSLLASFFFGKTDDSFKTELARRDNIFSGKFCIFGKFAIFCKFLWNLVLQFFLQVWCFFDGFLKVFFGRSWCLFHLFWQVFLASFLGKFDVSSISSGNFFAICLLLQVWCLFGVFLQVFFASFLCKFDASLMSKKIGRNWCLFHLFWQVGWVTDATKNLSKCTKEPTERD